MARTSQREVLADRQDAAQPALFDDEQMPVCAPALEIVRSRRYEHQGLRLVEDEAKGVRLVELIMLRWGVKRISREMNISVHTVRAARRLLAVQGKLAPYKQRVVEAMEDVIEQGVANYRDALEAGLVPAAQIPVGVAIMFDKRALAMGEPTSISGRGQVQDEELKVEAINAYLDQLPSCKPVETGAAIDSESTGNGAKAPQIGAGSVPDATLEAGRTQPSPDVGTPTATPGRATETPAPRDQAAEGGGGGPDRPALD
jgi:hypothetical protein